MLSISGVDELTMPYPALKKTDICDCKEINLAKRKDADFYQLNRLSKEFDLLILQVPRRAFSHISKQFIATQSAFVISNSDYQETGVVFSPWCDTLQELETYAVAHHIDILYEHLSSNTRKQ